MTKRLQLQGESKEIMINYFTRMRGDIIKTFKMINGISHYGRHFLNISLRTENLLSRQILKANWVFLPID